MKKGQSFFNGDDSLETYFFALAFSMKNENNQVLKTVANV